MTNPLGLTWVIWALALAGGMAGADPVLAQNFQDGALTDNPALLYPAFTGRCVDGLGNPTPCPDAINCVPGAEANTGCVDDETLGLRGATLAGDTDPGSPYDVTWSLTKRASAEFASSAAPRYLGELRPQLDFNQDAVGAALTGSAGADFRYLAGDEVYFSSFDAGVLGDYDFNPRTAAFFSGSFDASVPDPDDASLAANVAVVPVTIEVDGAMGLRRRLGRVTGEWRVEAMRGRVSDTVLDDSTVIDNSEFNRTAWGTGGRLDLEVTPVLGTFVDAGWRRERYDAASSGFGVPLDNVTTRARAGLTVDGGDDLSGEMSLGVLRRGFDDGTLTDVTTYLADAAVNWAPTRTTTFTASLATDVTPTTEPGSTTEISRLASLEAAYEATDTVRLRGSVAGEFDAFVGVAEQTNTATVGVGVDYLVNRFTTMFATLTGKSISDTTDGLSQSLAIEAGITVSR